VKSGLEQGVREFANGVLRRLFGYLTERKEQETDENYIAGILIICIHMSYWDDQIKEDEMNKRWSTFSVHAQALIRNFGREI
jgi:hypothetical protein